MNIFTHSGLLGQVGVHLLLAEGGHLLDLLVVALHSLLILGDLLCIQQLVGRGVLETHKKHVSVDNGQFSLARCSGTNTREWEHMVKTFTST